MVRHRGFVTRLQQITMDPLIFLLFSVTQTIIERTVQNDYYPGSICFRDFCNHLYYIRSDLSCRFSGIHRRISQIHQTKKLFAETEPKTTAENTKTQKHPHKTNQERSNR